MSSGIKPQPCKTIKVKSNEHNGQEVTINESEFNEAIHTHVDAPKATRPVLAPPAGRPAITPPPAASQG